MFILLRIAIRTLCQARDLWAQATQRHGGRGPALAGS